MNPTSQQILTVINNFKKVLPLAVLPNHLIMFEGNVNIDHTCGTVHCHGGWYAVAACDLSKQIEFYDGGSQLAKDLGFSYMSMLTDWAECNHEIWGNAYGRDMFCLRISFVSGNRIHGAQNLQDIINHWTEVYERILKIENETK